MWPFPRKQGRRLEAARARAEARAERMRRWRQTGSLVGLLIGLLFAAAGTAILLIGGRSTPFQLGQRLEQPLNARVAFDGPALKDRGTVRRFEPGEPIAFDTIDEIDFARIQAEHRAYLDSGQAGSPLLHALGLAGVMLLVTAGLGVYIAHYEPRAVRSARRTVGLAVLLLAAVLGARLTVLAVWQAELHLLATATATLLAVMILAIAYDRRFALGAGWFLALLMVQAARQDFHLLLVLLAGLTAAAMLLDEVRSRSRLVVVGLACGAVMAMTVLAAQLASGHWDRSVAWLALAAGGAGLSGGLIMQGLLPVVEWVFGIATAMTLLEFSDVSKPLLRRLATEAPGTFNHSLLLGTMAESAAEAIGANGLLARVGAYYHDVGKINKPPYFVENQEGTFSRHTKLSPAMSLLIILGHVKDGLELAREYKVPPVIYPFITEHHGTTLIEYFYHAAAARQAPDQAPPPEAQFRYPGPKPQSRETAILMLCDAVEGATRALAEPTPGRIEDLVHQIALKRLHDGQLDECNLTLRELHAVEQGLIKILCGFYHGRIAYPSGPARDAAPGKTA